MLSILQKPALYLRTIRWLRLSQLFWLAYRRIRPVTNPAPVKVAGSRQPVAATAFVSGPQPAERELRFLNVSVPADPEVIEWHPGSMSRLWRYNLHYFDYLRWSCIPDAWKRAYVDDWLQHNPVGCDDAWEPYTVSLRIVNWIRYFDKLASVPEDWQLSLINQANWLQSNLECHILANHYLKNAKALIFAGVWFEGDLGQKLLRRGMKIFAAQIAEQILADGGHFERSPMYHCIVLEDMLDVLNLMQAHAELFSAEGITAVGDTAKRSLHFLDEVLCADGRIPLFNDSAFGIAAEANDLFAYGSRLLDYKRLAPARKPLRIACTDSGYFGYRYGGDSLLVDCGQVGPDYQPGHAHCDMLSYELCIDGQRVVVDSGVHGYDGDDTRHYLRSTAAHNTVTLDGAEQSEIWGTFRLARRALPIRPQLSQIEGGRVTFTGGHDGYRRLPQQVTHTRSIEVDLSGIWKICDVAAGRGSAEMLSYVHFSADITVQPEDGNLFLLWRDAELVARLQVDAGCTVELRQAEIACEFGRLDPINMLVISRSGDLPQSSGYRIERHVSQRMT